MADFLSKLFDALTNIIPVHRWLDSATNALRALVAALVLWVMLAGICVLSLSGDQRFIALMMILLFFALTVASIVTLAFYRSGMGLYDPYQQSLARGRRFGSEKAPKSRAEVTEEPGMVLSPPSNQPALPTIESQAGLPPSGGGQA